MENKELMLGYNKEGMEKAGKLLGKLILWIFGLFVGLTLLFFIIF